ncbi:MAG: histidine phosphatase family protein [Chitinophagales bacterium]|nr:histidine phosphatase family protein [Chitinophagales bacterium]
MKLLYLVRHGKAAWRHQEMNDHERPLKKKGREETAFISQHLAQKGVRPGLLVTSPAKRALQTAEILAQDLEIHPDNLMINISLYNSSHEELLAVILGLPNEYNEAMLISHDPEIANIASFLTNSVFEKIPTAGVVCISFPTNTWHTISQNSGHIEYSLSPKMFV